MRQDAIQVVGVPGRDPLLFASLVLLAACNGSGSPGLPDMQGLHATLTAVANDAIAGSFTATWSDGSDPLTGTFSVPLCGLSP